MSKSTLFRLAIGLTLGVCCGCASGSRPGVHDHDKERSDSAVVGLSTSSNLYKLTVDFFLMPSKPVLEMTMYVRPGVSFGVKAEDKAGNHVQVGGTLWQLGQEKFQLNPKIIEMKYPGGSFGVPGSEPYELELGKESGGMGVDGIVFGGYSVLLTRE